MRQLALLLAAPLLIAETDIETDLDRLPSDWVTAKAAKHGMDLTRDGKVWINIDEYGVGPDYSLLATDLQKATGRWRRVWMRGHFANDPTIKHRESKTLVSVDCQERSFYFVQSTAYAPNGDIVDEFKGSPLQSTFATPGTFGETWTEAICAG